MPRSRILSNSGNAGVLDPLLLGRSDTEQFAQGLSRGDNIITIPQGGWRARPGTWRLRSLPAGARCVRFRFNEAEQYLLVFSDELVEVHELGVKITELETPYTASAVAVITSAGSADTLALYHGQYDPRRLLRASLATNPLRATSGSAVVLVRHPAHQLEDGDKVAYSGLTGPVGGFDVAVLNTSHTVDVLGATLGSNPFAVVDGDATITVTLPSGHRLVDGDRIEISGAVGGKNIASSDLNKIVTLGSVGATTATFEASLEADDTGAIGGSAVTYTTPDLYDITLGSNATGTEQGGGPVGLGWSITKQPLENIPRFDYADESSPTATNERQKLVFDGTWITGDEFKIRVDDNRSDTIDYDATDVDVTAQRIQQELLELDNTPATGIVVTYDPDSGGPGGGDEYFIDFEGEAGGRDWNTLDAEVTESDSGLLSVEVVAEGGRTDEEVWSATRGWPRCGGFFETRQWMCGAASRPTSFAASMSRERPFNFDTGDQFDAEAIHERLDGDYDQILHVAFTDRAWMFTPGGIHFVSAPNDEGITPGSLIRRKVTKDGSADIAPLEVASVLLYVDRRRRSVYELAAGENGAWSSRDIARFSPHLIKSPIRMDLLNYKDAAVKADYVFVANGDGTAAILSVESNQGIAAWSGWSTPNGAVKDVVQCDDALYLVVERTINGSTVQYLEKTLGEVDEYEDSLFLDCAIALTGSAQTVWTGLDHLEGEGVDVLADGVYVGRHTVSAGQITLASPADAVVVGLPYSVAGAPMPPTVETVQGSTDMERISIGDVLVDIYKSAGVKVNGRPLRNRAFGPDALSNPFPLRTEIVRKHIGGSGRRPVVTITQDLPFPLTVRTISTEVWF